MQDENVLNLINSCILNIENNDCGQNDIDNVYCEFVDIMHSDVTCTPGVHQKINLSLVRYQVFLGFEVPYCAHREW